MKLEMGLSMDMAVWHKSEFSLDMNGVVPGFVIRPDRQ